MGNTWIVNLRDYLTPNGAMAALPPPARILAEYFAAMVLDATSNRDSPPTVRCGLWRCTCVDRTRGDWIKHGAAT